MNVWSATPNEPGTLSYMAVLAGGGGRHFQTLYHEKTIRTYYTPKNGERRLKPYAQRIKEQLENGEAEYVHSKGKHIFVYPLNKKERRKYKMKATNVKS